MQREWGSCLVQAAMSADIAPRATAVAPHPPERAAQAWYVKLQVISTLPFEAGWLAPR